MSVSIENGHKDIDAEAKAFIFKSLRYIPNELKISNHLIFLYLSSDLSSLGSQFSLVIYNVECSKLYGVFTASEDFYFKELNYLESSNSYYMFVINNYIRKNYFLLNEGGYDSMLNQSYSPEIIYETNFVTKGYFYYPLVHIYNFQNYK